MEFSKDQKDMPEPVEQVLSSSKFHEINHLISC